MNTFTNSTVMVEYTKVHSAELIRQGQLANGYCHVRTLQPSLRRFVRDAMSVTPLKKMSQRFVGFFGSIRWSNLWSEAKQIPQIGASNG